MRSYQEARSDQASVVDQGGAAQPDGWRCATGPNTIQNNGGYCINRDFRGDPRDNRSRETRVNERIRAREVRLIDEDGQMIGVMSSGQALNLARERNLDLVEVSPMANPPVCKLMDYGRFKYEQAKKENEARKHQKTTELKEIRMRPRTDEHDLGVKVRKIEEFLGEGDKVKVGVIFRGREMAHPELGRQLLERVIAAMKAVAVLERPPIMEGKMMSMIMTRAPGWEPARKEAPEARERKKHGGQDGKNAPAAAQAAPLEVAEPAGGASAAPVAEVAESAETPAPPVADVETAPALEAPEANAEATENAEQPEASATPAPATEATAAPDATEPTVTGRPKTTSTRTRRAPAGAH